MSQNVTKKNLVIASLLSGDSVFSAAQKAGITERTVFRWLKDDRFTAELHRRESDLIHASSMRMISLVDKALTAIESVLDRPDQPGAGNLRLAGVSVLDLVLRWNEQVTLEERVSALERKVDNGRH